MYDYISSTTGAGVTAIIHRYAAFGSPSKGRLFLMDAFKWTPTGFATWIFERDRRPGMINVRENRRLAHEVAAKLIAEKQQELRDGDCGKDVLSLLGSSRDPFAKLDMWYNIQFFSQGKCRSVA